MQTLTALRIPTADPPTSTDLRDDRRFATPITPYRRGLEDALYYTMYTNPYRHGSLPWSDYEHGFTDGMRRDGV